MPKRRNVSVHPCTKTETENHLNWNNTFLHLQKKKIVLTLITSQQTSKINAYVINWIESDDPSAAEVENSSHWILVLLGKEFEVPSWTNRLKRDVG